MRCVLNWFSRTLKDVDLKTFSLTSHYPCLKGRTLCVFLATCVLCFLVYVTTVEIRAGKHYIGINALDNRARHQVLLSSQLNKSDPGYKRRSNVELTAFQVKEMCPFHSTRSSNGISSTDPAESSTFWTDDEEEMNTRESEYDDYDDDEDELHHDTNQPHGYDIPRDTLKTEKMDTSVMNIPSTPVQPVLLKGYRNPCWIERLRENNPYRKNLYQKFNPSRFNKIFKTLQKSLKMRLQKYKHWRLRCLPYFYLIGQPKCGTTDLYFKLALHPDIITGATKEPHWWTRRRFGITSYRNSTVPFRDFVDLFDKAAEVIRSKVKHRTKKKCFHPAITAEASASTLWDNDQWQLFPENAGLHEPKYITAHYIRQLQPNAKFVVILRNPTDRLFSDYLYFGKFQKSVEDFHQRVNHSIQLMVKCSEQNCVRSCAYNSTLNQSHLRVRLRIGMYYIFIKDWLDVFPREQVMIVTLEEYSARRHHILNKICKFLGLDPLPLSVIKKLNSLSVANTRRKGSTTLGSMLPQTRQLLDSFYRSFNLKLADLLNDEKFAFNQTNDFS